MIRSFILLSIVLGLPKSSAAQEELTIEVKSFDIVPGVGPQTKLVRFSYEHVDDEEASTIMLRHVHVSYDVAASMDITIDFYYSSEGVLTTFIKSVKGYECGKETMHFEQGELTYRTFEPYDMEECAGDIRTSVQHQSAERLDKVDFQRAKAEQIEAGRYRKLFKELSNTLLNH